MANMDVFDKSSMKNFIKTSDSFENDIKSRLKWSKKQWISAGEEGNRYNKLCNSLNYWKDKLKDTCEDVSIVFTLFNVDRDIKMELFTIVTEIEKIDNNIKIQGFAEFRNPRYIAIYFNSKEEKDFISQRFKMINDNYVVYLNWALEQRDQVRNLNVYWLPWTMKIEVIEEMLQKYVKCIENHRLNTTFMSGRTMQSGKIGFKVTLNDGVTAESIPHVMKIANLEALITIPGRLPLCLNCNELGHISKKCNMRYCSICERMCKREHECVNSGQGKSYAFAVKSGEKNESRLDLDDWKAVTFTKEETAERTTLGKELPDLDSTIVNIQDKIKVLDAAIQENVTIDENNKTYLLKPRATDADLSIDESSSDSLSDVLEDIEIDQLTDNALSAEERENVEKRKTNNESIKKKTVQVNVVKKRNKKRKIKNKDVNAVLGNLIADQNPKTKESDLLYKSYGRSGIISERKKYELKQEKRFNKVTEEQEFVFTD